MSKMLFWKQCSGTPFALVALLALLWNSHQQGYPHDKMVLLVPYYKR